MDLTWRLKFVYFKDPKRKLIDKEDHDRRDIQTSSCTIKEHTITNSASKNRCVEQCQYVIGTVLLKTPTYSRVIVKNCKCHKRETANNHMLQQKWNGEVLRYASKEFLSPNMNYEIL